MTPETGREAECWIKLSLLTVLSVPEILRLLQQTGGVEALFDASSGTLTKLARLIRAERRNASCRGCPKRRESASSRWPIPAIPAS